jgi:hypothetical protein
MTGLIRSFFAHVIPQVARPLRILWNEIIALLFFVIAIPFTLSAVRSFRKAEQDGDALFGAFLAAIVAAVMLCFGIYSFLRARRISRS